MGQWEHWDHRLGFVLEVLVVGATWADGAVPFVKVFAFGSSNGNLPEDVDNASPVSSSSVDRFTPRRLIFLLVDVDGPCRLSCSVWIAG